MARRYYSSTARRTTLSAGITAGQSTITITAAIGLPGSYPYTMVIDPDTVNEEIIEVSARSGLSLTVTRGVDGTSGVSHSAGAVIQHGVSARDFDEANAHVSTTGTVHGVTGSLVGTTDTQTLTNKTLVDPVFQTTMQSKSGSYTFGVNDAGKTFEFTNSTAATLTIPADTTSIPVGSMMTVIRLGSGSLNLVGAGGVTLNATPGLNFRAQYSAATLLKRGANNWVAFGDLAP